MELQMESEISFSRFMDLPRHQSRAYGMNANSSSFNS